MSTAASVMVRQYRRARFQALTADRPTVMLVRAGSKRVQAGGGVMEVGAGALGLLPARTPLTIENRPPPGGAYAASALLIAEDLVESTRRGQAPETDPWRVSRNDRAVAAFERAIAAVEDPLTPERLRAHAVGEALLWLAEDGVGFAPARPPSFADRLRALLSADPAEPWKSTEAARALAVSEATLRRRLAAEGVGFGDLLIDIRMTRALGLLQTTTLPTYRIAEEVGYASPSRFAMRFRARFGLAPSEIRGEGDFDRIGAETERRGATEEGGDA